MTLASVFRKGFADGAGFVGAYLKRFRVGDRRVFFLCFTLGFIVRLIPEVLSYPHPIGFDTVYYAARLKSGLILHHWSEFFSSTWLFYAFLTPLYGLVDGDPFLLLKFVAPTLYGLNVAGIHYFEGALELYSDGCASFGWTGR